jgi:hypothetical protein
MTSLNRVRIEITGVVGKAYMNWYFTVNASGNITALGALLDVVRLQIPQTITYIIPNAGDVIDDADGKLVGSWGAGTPLSKQGQTTDSYAGQAGAMVLWNTTGVVDSHRPKGRALWVPLGRSVYGTDGRLTSTFSATLAAASTTFIANSQGFVVWHRPVYTGDPPNRVLSRPGSNVPVSSATVSPTLATLRSRNH